MDRYGRMVWMDRAEWYGWMGQNGMGLGTGSMTWMDEMRSNGTDGWGQNNMDGRGTWELV